MIDTQALRWGATPTENLAKMKTLPEVAVANADAATQAIYESIMKHSGTGTPALIFRHFAVFPGLLEWTWRAVGEDIRSGHVMLHALDAVARTPRVELPSIGSEALAAAGVDTAGQALLGAIFANYNRMNPMNYSLIAAIRELMASPKVPAEEVAPLPPPLARMPPPCPKLPPPVNVGELPSDLQQGVIRLSAAIPRAGAQVVPTLYRHLAIWPDLMRRLVPGILHAIENGDVTARMRELETEMQPLISSVTMHARQQALPPAPLEDPGAMVRTLDSFLFAIPHMIVIGTALEAALPPAVAARRDGTSHRQPDGS